MRYKYSKSERKDKQLKVTVDGKTIHFGDPKMEEYPLTKRGDKFCTRTFGIKNKKGEVTRNNPKYANFHSRKKLWKCKGKKSVR